jgi:hypothetical protein
MGGSGQAHIATAMASAPIFGDLQLAGACGNLRQSAGQAPAHFQRMLLPIGKRVAMTKVG